MLTDDSTGFSLTKTFCLLKLKCKSLSSNEIDFFICTFSNLKESRFSEFSLSDFSSENMLELISLDFYSSSYSSESFLNISFLSLLSFPYFFYLNANWPKNPFDFSSLSDWESMLKH